MRGLIYFMFHTREDRIDWICIILSIIGGLIGWFI